ncbi:MAG TPA: sulfur carrier protein ThiS [Bryobacteraceae bacterium]|nr:sulfur carrier protein ThiS [Bryobacteraceae bacterium]
MSTERNCQSLLMGIAQTNHIEIVLNGEKKHVPANLNIEGLLVWLQMDPSRVAVEFNGVIVRKPSWQATEVAGGSQIEIVWFVGGGQI